MKGQYIPYSDEELTWIKACCDLPRAELHALFVQIFKRTDVSKVNLTSLCKRKGWLTGRTGQFTPGQTSHNKGRKGLIYPGSEKGWFKKGDRTGRANQVHKEIGTERITVDGYLERKVNEDLPMQRRWRTVHSLNWEAQNGAVPDGFYLKCLDGNKLNTDPSNWELLPNAMKPRLNGKFGRGYDTAPAELKPTILLITKLEHEAREKRRAGTKEGAK